MTKSLAEKLEEIRRSREQGGSNEILRTERTEQVSETSHEVAEVTEVLPARGKGFLDRLRQIPSAKTEGPETVEKIIAASPAPQLVTVLDTHTKQTTTALTAQPVQDVAADITSLRGDLDFLKSNINNKELVGAAVRKIVTELKSKPFLHPYMANSDFDTVIAGMMSAFNVQARKKAEGKQKKAATSKDSEEIAAAFRDLGIKF